MSDKISNTKSDIVDLQIVRFDAQISTSEFSKPQAQNEAIDIQAGKILELLCTAHGRPAPEVNWFKDHRPISQKSTQFKSKLDNNMLIAKQGDTTFLRFNRIQLEDSGTYSCQAQSVNGHIKQWIVVKVQPYRNITVPVMKKPTARKVCPIEPCNGHPCELNNNGFYTCRCPFSYSGENCQGNPMLDVPPKNSSSFDSHSDACRNNKPTNLMSDQLFTIFETMLVCVIAAIFLAVLFYICRKYGIYSQRKNQLKKTCSKAIQVEIMNYAVVRDVGINVNGYQFEHGGDKLVPVAFHKHQPSSVIPSLSVIYPTQTRSQEPVLTVIPNPQYSTLPNQRQIPLMSTSLMNPDEDNPHSSLVQTSKQPLLCPCPECAISMHTQPQIITTKTPLSLQRPKNVDLLFFNSPTTNNMTSGNKPIITNPQRTKNPHDLPTIPTVVLSQGMEANTNTNNAYTNVFM